jgi:hypothetical protein
MAKQLKFTVVFDVDDLNDLMGTDYSKKQLASAVEYANESGEGLAPADEPSISQKVLDSFRAYMEEAYPRDDF